MSNSRKTTARWLALAGLISSAVACQSSLFAPRAAGPQPATPARRSSEAPPPEDASEAETVAVEAAGGSAGEDDSHAAEALDDSGETAEPTATETLSVRPHPLDKWTDAQVAAAVSHDLRSLGPMSLDSPNAGALINGVQAT